MLEGFRVLAAGLDHPEGVAWSPQGLLYAGGEAGQIYAITLDGRVERVADTGGFVLGLAVDGAGRVYACDEARGEVLRVTPSTGEVEVYSAGAPGVPMRTPNFPAFDDRGTLYVTDSGAWRANDGVVFRIDPGGRTAVWTREAPRFPNGCCLGPGGNALYVVESTGECVTRIPILPDGSPGPAEHVAELPGCVPDGIAVDAAGDLVVSCYRPDRILRVAAGGSVEVLVDDPRGEVLNQPTNVAFVGETLGELAVASLGGWQIAVGAIGVSGCPLRYPDVA